LQKLSQLSTTVLMKIFDGRFCTFTSCTVKIPIIERTKYINKLIFNYFFAVICSMHIDYGNILSEIYSKFGLKAIGNMGSEEAV
jgi:hypothetical protein